MLQVNLKFALVQYSVAKLENYNPVVILESDNLEELENIDTDGYGVDTGFTIVERMEDGTIEDYYQGDIFEMNAYN